MIPGKNCNIAGRYVSAMIHDCFEPDVDVYVFRDASPEAEEIYFGKAADLPSLYAYRVIDIQWDSYNYVFSIEVK